MIRLIAVALTIALATPAAAQPYASLMETANRAFEDGDWKTVSSALDEAQEQRPYSLNLWRNRILAYAMLKDFAQAQVLAETIADRGLSIRVAGHPGFDALTSRSEFAPVMAKMAANMAPIGDAKTALTYDDDGLLPETFAQTKSDARFIGSVRTGKIIHFDKEGEGEGFAIAPGGVYDIETDAGTLWAAVNSAPPFEGAGKDAPTAAIVAYNLKTGAESAAWRVKETDALIGDLEMTPQGLIASDSMTPRLFILKRGDKEPRLLAQDPRFVNLQGLAYDKHRKKLYVADYLAGLFSVDMKTNAVTAIANTTNAHLGGIDGLYLYKGDLIGVQNGTTPQRIVRIRLNAAGDDAIHLDVIQQNLPEWREPSNGKIVGDALYYVGTTNWPAYSEDGAIDESVKREPVRVMTAPVN